MSHWSLDFETLGLEPSCKVLSLGIAKFDIRTGEILSTKLFRFKAAGQEHRTKTPSTEAWWAKQSEEAKKEAFGGTQSLQEIIEFGKMTWEHEQKAMVWGNGANFDVAILDNIFGYQAPWDFWNVRDMRTIVWAAEAIGFNKDSVKREGVHHSAIDDAVHQAKVISNAYRYIKGLHGAYYDLKAKHQELIDAQG